MQNSGAHPLPYCFILLSLLVGHGINHTGKLCEKIITGCIHDTAPVLVDQGRNEGTIGSEGADSGFFIVPMRRL